MQYFTWQPSSELAGEQIMVENVILATKAQVLSSCPIQSHHYKSVFPLMVKDAGAWLLDSEKL